MGHHNWYVRRCHYQCRLLTFPGILIQYYWSYGSSFLSEQDSANYNTAAWRLPWGLQALPGVLLFFLMFLLPESPRWLARKDRWEECHAVLTLVHGRGDTNHPFVSLEMQDIKDQCELERRHADVTYLDLFKPNMIHRTLIGLFIQIWSQLTGMNVMSKQIPQFGAIMAQTNVLASVLYQ